MKIYPDKQDQTIAFEIDPLPNEVFKIVIPEIVSHNDQVIIPWSEKVPQWTIRSDFASWHCEIPSVVDMVAEICFSTKKIEAVVTVTNLSRQGWELTNAFTCFAFYQAPLFDDPRLERIYLPVANDWESLASVLAQAPCPGEAPCTFFQVEGSANISDLWLGRTIDQTHSQAIKQCAVCVVSQNNQWVAGITTYRAGYVFVNRRERCIHANPVYDFIPPGDTASERCIIHIMKGDVSTFKKESLACQ